MLPNLFWFFHWLSLSIIRLTNSVFCFVYLFIIWQINISGWCASRTIGPDRFFPKVISLNNFIMKNPKTKDFLPNSRNNYSGKIVEEATEKIIHPMPLLMLTYFSTSRYLVLPLIKRPERKISYYWRQLSVSRNDQRSSTRASKTMEPISF